MSNPIKIIQLFDAVTVTAGVPAYSDPIELDTIAPNGFFVFEYEITGAGVLTIDHLAAISGPYRDPSNAPDIGTDLTSGGDILPWFPESVPRVKIRARVTLGTDDCILSAWLSVS